MNDRELCLHVLSVDQRLITIMSGKFIVQNGINVDAIKIDFDSEWDGLTKQVILSNGVDDPKRFVYEPPYLKIPSALIDEDGSELEVSVLGYKGSELCSLVENVNWNPKTFIDELEIDSEGNVSLIKRVFTAHIDGSEPMQPRNTDKFQYFNYAPKTVHPIDGSNAIRSNRFGKISRDPWSFYVAGGSDAALFFTFPLGTFANADELNEWLSKNPIDVNYLGAETKTIPLGKIELPALPESVSNVWTDAGVTPKTGIEYTRDVNIVVGNLEKAIASITEG